MVKEIASILKGRLSSNGGLPFVEVMAGLAQKVEFKMEDANGNPITKKMPVAHDVTAPAECLISPERAVVPDSTKKGILYFEDLGSVYIDRVSGGAQKWQSTLVLVCWMNRARLVGNAYAEITTHCVTAIMNKIGDKRPTNEGNFSRFKVIVGRMLPQDASVFSRYTYDESVTQHLRPPFEFFGLQLTVEYCIHPSCLTELNYTEPICY